MSDRHDRNDDSRADARDGVAASFWSRASKRLRTAWRPNITVTPVPPGILAEWDVPVKMRDGTVLRANVFRPESGGPFPVILSAHPYGKDKLPAKTKSARGLNPQYRLFPQPQPITFSEWTSWEAPDPAFWVPRGYAVMNLDLRGAGTSEGVGDLLSDKEALDYYDAIEWAGTQPWSSGRVGLDGVSYLAISQYKVAALRPPHLAALIPWEGFSDLYRDFARPGGGREDGFLIVWSKSVGRTVRLTRDLRAGVLAHTERDAWYEALTPRLEQIEAPILVCASFSDHSLHSRGSFEVFRRAGSKEKWLTTHRSGKWCAYYSPQASELRARFFDCFLRGIDNGFRDEPRVRLAIADHGPDPAEIRGESAFPPADLRLTSLSLDAHSATLRLGAAPTEPRRISSSTSGEGLRFSWQVPDDMDVIGPMALRLYVSLQGADDAVLFVGVRKSRDGAEQLFEGSFGWAFDMVTRGFQRVSHRELDPELSSEMQPVHTHLRREPLAPGEIAPVDIALLPHATRFRRGDTMTIHVRGSWHYPQDPLRGQFPCSYEPSPRGTFTLHTGGAYAARLLLGHRPSKPPR